MVSDLDYNPRHPSGTLPHRRPSHNVRKVWDRGYLPPVIYRIDILRDDFRHSVYPSSVIDPFRGLTLNTRSEFVLSSGVPVLTLFCHHTLTSHARPPPTGGETFWSDPSHSRPSGSITGSVLSEVGPCQNVGLYKTNIESTNKVERRSSSEVLPRDVPPLGPSFRPE